jgi:peptidyl-prolyl cis-trans isomerase C
MRSLLARMAAIVVASIVGAVAAFSQQGSPEDPVVARVNGAEIRRSEVIAEQQSLPAEYRSVPFEAIFPHLLRRMIDGRLRVAEARRLGLPSSPEVKARLAVLEERVLEQALLSKEIEDKVTEAELRRRYEGVAKAGKGQEQVRARHILVESEAEAVAIIADLGKPGADFAKLARDRSKDTAAAARGGDLGFFLRGDMVKPFADAAFALKPGETTKAAVRTQFGWHIIKLEERRTAPVPAFEEVRDELGRELSEEITTKLIESLRAASKIEMLVPEGGIADPGAPSRSPANSGEPPARVIRALPAQPVGR